jgi:sugar phosphate isomerase/epimerase
MKTIKGPAIFLAQFAGDLAPFNTLEGLAEWAAGLGYRGVQIPTWLPGLFDLERAATSTDYCDEIIGMLAGHGLELTELSTHLQGQLIAVHPAYDLLFDGFAPDAVRGNPTARQAWAQRQLQLAAKASANLKLPVHVTFSGALAWPYFYPWPQRSPGLIDDAFAELASRWRPLLDRFDACGVDVAFELHPGEDLHDGLTFDRFLEAVDQHPRAGILYDPSHLVLQHIDYLAFLDHYHPRIRAVHIKDAELRLNGRTGVYGGYVDWQERAGRFRSLGDGQIDFKALFTKLAQYDFPGWAVLEWECAFKNAQDGAREGAAFIRDHIIRVSEHGFDDFAASGADSSANAAMLGLIR